MTNSPAAFPIYLEPRLPADVLAELRREATRQGVAVAHLVRFLLGSWLRSSEAWVLDFPAADLNISAKVRTTDEQRGALRHIRRGFGVSLGQILGGALYQHLQQDEDFCGWETAQARRLSRLSSDIRNTMVAVER